MAKMGLINNYFQLLFNYIYFSDQLWTSVTKDYHYELLKRLLNELFLAFLNAYIICCTSWMQHEAKENWD